MSSVGRAITKASSSVNEPSSSSRSTRSRAASLPFACCCWVRASPPPLAARRRRPLNRSLGLTRLRIRRLDRYEIRLAGELHQLRRELCRLPEEACGGAEVLHEVTRMARTPRDVPL